MRTTVVIALAISSIAGAALAQNAQTSSALEAKTNAREKDPSYRAFERNLSTDLERRKEALAASGTLSDVSAVEPVKPPIDWTKGSDAWRAHMDKCSARYRTYDPTKDMYTAKPGEQRRCAL